MVISHSYVNVYQREDSTIGLGHDHPDMEVVIMWQWPVTGETGGAGYFQSLLRPYESLPYLWSPTLREDLRGTDAEDTVAKLQ